MIRAVFYGDERGLRGFEARGHAGFAPWGTDIVCAAVSAVMQTAAIGLSALPGARTRKSRRDGFLSASVPTQSDDGARYRASLILETAKAGLSQIATQYPGFVRVIGRKRRRSHVHGSATVRP